MARIKHVRHLRILTRQKKFDRLQCKQYRGVYSNHNNHTHNASLLNNNVHNNNSNTANNLSNNSINNDDNNNCNIPRGDNSNNKTDDTNKKWVIDMSNSPLTEVQRTLLVWWPKFAVVPRHHQRENT